MFIYKHEHLGLTYHRNLLSIRVPLCSGSEYIPDGDVDARIRPWEG